MPDDKRKPPSAKKPKPAPGRKPRPATDKQAGPATGPKPVPPGGAPAGVPGGDLPETVRKELAALDEQKRDGKLTAFEHAAKRKALLQGIEGQGKPKFGASPAAPAKPTGEPGAGAKETAPAAAGKKPEEADEKKPDVKLPGAWAAKEKERRAGPKTWTEGARTDDPTKRVVHPPTADGIGSGRSFLFLFGFRIHSPRDQEFLEKELKEIDDDVAVLRGAGYTVVVDPQATRKDLLEAVTGRGEGVEKLAPAGVYWSAHGSEDGSVQTCDGGFVVPDDLESDKIDPGLRLMVFASCYVGSRSRTWRKALGGRPMVVGWGRPVTIDRAVEFLQSRADTETDLDDLIRRYLLTDAPIPGEGGLAYAPVDDAASRGRLGDVPERLRTVVEMLGAKWKTEPNWVEVDVPLEDKRWEKAKVFVVESAEPYCEGEPMLAVESDVGELTAVVDPPMLLSGFGGPGYARVSLVKSGTDMPRIVVQGFLPIARARDQDLAALVYQVAQVSDRLEQRIFGGDMR
ncbi:MAG: hypothetical protein JXB32_13385 [Deltaproteobacteria bacterium]|nr:hypothetical protein [Deltaproteobacteria bacterium]